MQAHYQVGFLNSSLLFPTLPYSPLCSLIPLYSLYTLSGSWALGVKGTVLYNCGVELGVCD